MSTPSSCAGCSYPKRYDSSSPLLLRYSPLCVADSRSPPAMKRRKIENAIGDLRRRLDFDSDSEVNCCTPPPSRKNMENKTVADSAAPPPPRKIKKNVPEMMGRKLDFDSADADTLPRPQSFDYIALRRAPPPAFPAVRWNSRAMDSFFKNPAPINLR